MCEVTYVNPVGSRVVETAPDPHWLLDAAVRRLNVKSQPGKGPAGPLAKRLGFSYQRVYRWYQEGNAPDYEGVMVLLAECGWLNITERRSTNSPRPRI